MKAIHLKRILPKLGYCILCNQKRPLTREHIFAAWIGKTGIGNQKMSLESFRNGQTGTEWKQEVHNGNHADRTLPVLCKECNNEFGSDLQSAVAPILKPLIEGEWKPLSNSQRGKIAKWATCYQYVREFTRTDLVTTNREERLRFRNTSEPPPGFAVWMGTAANSADNLPHWHRPIVSERGSITPQPWDVAIDLLVIGHVVCFIFSTSNPNLIPFNSTIRFGLMKFLYAQGLVQVWPVDPAFPSKPPAMTDEQIGTLIPNATSVLANPLPWLPFNNLKQTSVSVISPHTDDS